VRACVWRVLVFMNLININIYFLFNGFWRGLI
jgi:hypothetical protein